MKYTPTIGIECHVQLKTVTKLFDAVDNDARIAPPNTLAGPLSFGLPGTLPVLNEAAVELACRAAFALGVRPQVFSKFDRKHYFYPDLPKGYQITQFDEPIVVGGKVDITVNSQLKTVHITRAHLEEDAGKSTHPEGADYSLVDLNRAGTPLLEIVSEPEMHSALEAKAYARELYLRMKYAGVSDANLYYGNMRFDVNVSLSQNPKMLGTRSETKNLNSFKSVEKAVDYEIARQTELLSHGEKVIQETRGWHDDKQKTFSQRTKEDSHDYRYFPDPDLPPVVLTKKFIDRIARAMPPTVSDLRGSMTSAGIDGASVEALLEYPSLVNRWFDVKKINSSKTVLKRVGDWFASVILGQLANNTGIDLERSIEQNDTYLNAKALIKLADMVDSQTIGSSAAKQILMTYWTNLYDPLAIAKEMELLQNSDTDELGVIVEKVLQKNDKAAEDIKNGELKAVGFLVGEVMKASAGKANPQMVQKLIKKKLGV